MSDTSNYKFLLMILFLLIFSIPAESTELKLINEIGSDDENYMFQRVTGAVISNQKNIFALDTRGNFLAKYGWNGKFVKKIGQKGQGPNDFHWPSSLHLYEGKLYLWDGTNARIAEIDLQLNNVKYYPVSSGMPFHGNFFIIGKDKCVGPSFSFSVNYYKEYKAIKILDFMTQASIMVFEKFPHPRMNSHKVLKNLGKYIFYLKPSIGIDRGKKKLIISFTYPSDPVKFYEYSYEGRCLNEFSYSFDKDYVYPEHLLNGKLPPKGEKVILLNSIHVYKKYYFVFTGKVTYHGGMDIEKENYCLVFDKESKLMIQKFRVPDFLEVYNITDKGYVAATRNFEDTPKICIYKLEGFR